MSSLRGEEALKDGLSFEFTWTARHLLEVMEERADWIQLGGRSDENGVDFRLGFSTHEEHHQVKRAFGNKGEWSLAALSNQSVLANFNNQLKNPNVHCHFVSTLPAVQLGYLANRARSAQDFDTFQKTYLSGSYQDWFDDLVRMWALADADCWTQLKRVSTRLCDEQEIESSSLSMLRAMVIGDARDAWVHLRNFCFDHLHQKKRSSELWAWLATKGIQRQIVTGDPRVLEKLEAQTTRYLNGVRSKLIQPVLFRSIASTVVSTITEADTAQDIIILGAPGGGKSAVMLQIADSCIKKGWPVLAFRLDELSASLTPKELQDALDLPLPLASSIAFAAAGKPALVVIDQLDAVSHYSGRTSVLFDRVSELVLELRGHRLRSPIHIVIACRDVDWRHDGRFKKLHRPNADASNKEEGIHKVEGFTDDEIKTILTKSGFDIAAFSPRQRNQLLRRPQYLAILIETHPSPEDLPRIVTPKQLFDAYWDKKQRAMSKEFRSSAINLWPEILRQITLKLSETALALAPLTPGASNEDDAPLAIPKRLIESFPTLAIDWMITNGVLVESGKLIRFAHESLFDYCFARFFEEQGETMLQYLLRSDQTLIQRGQLRQVMSYLRDENPANYLATAQSLLASDQIRPHLKLLLVVVLCEAPEPSKEEWALILPYLENSLSDFDSGKTTTLSCQFFYTFTVLFPLFQIACKTGAFTQWLHTSGPKAVERLFQVMLKHQGVAQTEVWRQLAPLVNNPRYELSLDWLSQFCHASDSRDTFEWLLTTMRSSFEQNEQQEHKWHRFHSLTEDLAKNKPEWLAEWIAALIRARAKLLKKVRSDLILDHSVQSDLLRSAAHACPAEFIRHVLPATVEALELNNQYMDISSSDYADQSPSSIYISTDTSLLDALISSLRTLVIKDPAITTKWLDELRVSSSRQCERIHAAVLCGETPEFASLAADYLIDGVKGFRVSYRGKPVACTLLARYAKHIPSARLSQIEDGILDYYPDWEFELPKDHQTGKIQQGRGNSRGSQQMIILRSLPNELLSTKSKCRLAEWERKFSSLGRLFPEKHKRKPINQTVLVNWGPDRFHSAFVARLHRIPKTWRRDHSDGESNIRSFIPDSIKANPGAYIRYLSVCDDTTDKYFLNAVAGDLSRLELTSSQALDAAVAFHKLGNEWADETVRFLDKISTDHLKHEAFELVIEYATVGATPSLDVHQSNENKRGERLHSAALNSVRGYAIRTLCRLLWDDPELVTALRGLLPTMMREPNAAIRSELASVCYAVAFTELHRPFAMELFVILVTENLPDEHVLSSHWPSQFMLVGLREHWLQFRPIISSMLKSDSSEVRSAGARLACVAVVSGVDAIDLAQNCITSSDTSVRSACADVLGHNIEVEYGKPWTTEAFLQLADDPDKDVCRATGHGFYRSHRKHPLDLGPLENLLKQYVKSRAFVLGPSHLIDAISDSNSVLPQMAFDIIQSLIRRLHEPIDDAYDRLSYHVKAASTVLKRLYHENRDGTLRLQALNLIDELCLRGTLSVDNLDE